MSLNRLENFRSYLKRERSTKGDIQRDRLPFYPAKYVCHSKRAMVSGVLFLQNRNVNRSFLTALACRCGSKERVQSNTLNPVGALQGCEQVESIRDARSLLGHGDIWNSSVASSPTTSTR